MSKLFTPSTTAGRVWRVLGWVTIVLVLGLAFWGYLTPSMMVNWESLAAMCGF